MPDLSIVIPSFGRADVLLGTVLALFNQTFLANRPAELLISIDKSDRDLQVYQNYTAQLSLIAKEHLPLLKILTIVNTSNGLLLAKNSAVKKSRSSYIMMLDDDLYMEPDYIQTLYSEISTKPEIGAISGYIVSYVPAISHTQPSDKITKAPQSKFIQTLKLEADSNGTWRSMFGRKEQVMDWSGFNKKLNPATRYEMDYFVNSYMFSRDAYDRVNGYTPQLNSKTSAHEEVDFTFRIRKTGRKLVFNPFVRMWHITIGKGGIYKGKNLTESKKILEEEYSKSLEPFLRSISGK